MAASELGVRSLQLPARRVGAPEESKHADFPRADTRLTLVDADAPRNAFQAGDLTPSDARRPGKGLADANRPLDANSHLDQDVAGRHGSEGSVGQTVEAISPADRRRGAPHRRAARCRDARAGDDLAAQKVPAGSRIEVRCLERWRAGRCDHERYEQSVPDDEWYVRVGARGPETNRGERVGRLLGRVSRLEARGAGPDQGGDEPEVTPVQRVHERAVQEDPQPGS